ncbi:MAG: phosphatase PAP2 family protein [Huintestinicola sp.]
MKKIKEFYDKKCDSYLDFFRRCEKYFTAKPSRMAALKVSSKLSTVFVYAAYIFIVGVLAWSGDERVIPVLCVPGTVFLIITAVRKKLDYPRPYQRLPITPLLKKETKGKSCPSRHTGCAAVIGIACLYVSPILGIAVLLDAVFIAVIRPAAGVHFPLDTIFGGAIALVFGCAGFFAFSILM